MRYGLLFLFLVSNCFAQQDTGEATDTALKDLKKRAEQIMEKRSQMKAKFNRLQYQKKMKQETNEQILKKEVDIKND